MNPFAFKTLPPWDGPLPEIQGRQTATLVLPVPVGTGSLLEPEQAARYLESLFGMMKKAFEGKGFEVLMVPYGNTRPAEGNLLRRLLERTAGRTHFRWLQGSHAGPGAAVRQGVFSSRGRLVMVGNLEYYYEPDFFLQGLELLRKDRGLTGVRANRRLPDAEFIVPVKLLSMVYRRHLLGVLLMKTWKVLFDIGTSDALSGAYVLRRNFALRAFNRVTCPWFLYGVELAVLAKANGLRLRDIPAHFFMEAEKSRLRLWSEVLKVFRWTFRVFHRVRRGEYRFMEHNGNQFTADDWGLSPGVNEGILRLARLGHLKRVSVLGGGKYVPYKLRELKRVPGMEFGLHFNLTCPEAGGPFPGPLRFFCAWMMARVLGRRGVLEKVRGALQEQIEDLRRRGVRPVRFDGHHHVHAVPGLLREVSDLLKAQGVPYVRAPYHPGLGGMGRTLVAMLGWSLKRTLRHSTFMTADFCYPIPSDFESLNRLVARLNRTRGAEVLVHPASRDDIAQTAPSDPLRGKRVGEFSVLRVLGLEFRLSSRKNWWEGAS